MMRKGTVPALLAAVAAATVVAATGMSGFGAPPGSVDGPSVAPEEATVGGSGSRLQGDVSVDLGNVSWIDIAYVLHDGMTRESVNLSVFATWGDAPRDDRTQPWMCTAQVDTGPSLPRPKLHTATCSLIGYDGAIEFHARYGDHDVDQAVPDPRCTLLGCHEGTKMGVDGLGKTFLNVSEILGDRNRTTFHLLVATGSYPPESIEIEGRIDDTRASMRTGPAEDRFTRFREDFDSSLYARADVPGEPHYQTAAEHVKEVQGEEPMAYWYMPAPLDADEDRRYWIERPDGTRETGEGLWGYAGLSHLEGRWTFGYSGSHGRGADFPILMGMRFDPAEPP